MGFRTTRANRIRREYGHTMPDFGHTKRRRSMPACQTVSRWRHFDSAGIRTSSLGGGERVAFLAVGRRHVEIDRRKQLAAGIADEVPLTALDNQQRSLP